MERKQIDLQDAIVYITCTAAIFFALGMITLFLAAKADGIL